MAPGLGEGEATQGGVASGSGVKAPPLPDSGPQSGEDAVTTNPQDFCDKQSSMVGVGRGWG